MWCEPQIASARLHFFQYVNTSTTYFEKYTCCIWGKLIPKVAGTSEIWAVGQDYMLGHMGRAPRGHRVNPTQTGHGTERGVTELRAARDGLSPCLRWGRAADTTLKAGQTDPSRLRDWGRKG